MMKFFTIYNRPKSPSVPKCSVDLAEQQYKADCDIASVLKRFAQGDKTVVHDNAVFGDVSELGDFATCMERVRQANEAFANLPAEVRARFAHNPLSLVQFLHDEKNYNEAVRLGLCKPRVIDKKEEEIVSSVTTEKVEEVATSASSSK